MRTIQRTVQPTRRTGSPSNNREVRMVNKVMTYVYRPEGTYKQHLYKRGSGSL